MKTLKVKKSQKLAGDNSPIEEKNMECPVIDISVPAGADKTEKSSKVSLILYDTVECVYALFIYFLS